MNRLQWGAIASFSMLAALVAFGFGTSLREEGTCDDTSDCTQPPISTRGWVVMAGGFMLGMAGITAVMQARRLPPGPP